MKKREEKEFMVRETAVVVKSKAIYFYFLSEICKMELESLEWQVTKPADDDFRVYIVLLSVLQSVTEDETV